MGEFPFFQKNFPPFFFPRHYSSIFMRQKGESCLGAVVQNSQESGPKYWATHSLVYSHCSLIHLLHIACFARALRCAHLFVHSLTYPLPSFWESGSLDGYFGLFFLFLTIEQGAKRGKGKNKFKMRLGNVEKRKQGRIHGTRCA